MSAASAVPVALASPTYSRRRPETSALYRVVQDNLRTLHAAIEHGLARPLPGFVRDELERFVDCGVLAHGWGVTH